MESTRRAEMIGRTGEKWKESARAREDKTKKKSTCQQQATFDSNLVSETRLLKDAIVVRLFIIIIIVISF